jgi:glycosyltransferase involved in cell wall biosynthesis
VKTATASEWMPRPICVIIPTFNRAQVLALCLEHLERQTYTDFEVLVVDDGSTDDTAATLERFVQNSSLRMRTLRQPNSGPAKGRNLAIQAADSPLCILIGDDILVSPNFVEQHRLMHQGHSSESTVGLGLTRWDTVHQQVTPFMAWLENVQFSYHELEAGTQPDWRYLYTSNLSFKTKLFREWPFHEGFRFAAFEDMELGYRLARAGKLEVIYHPQAFATHVHPTSFLDACRRMEKVGYSEAQFLEAHPEAAALFTRGHPFKQLLYALLAKHPRVLEWLTRAANRLSGERRPTILVSGLLMAHHRRGLALYEHSSEQATPV